MACRLTRVCAILSLGLLAGCISLLTERGPVGGVDYARDAFEVRSAVVTYSEARIHWEDGLQGREIREMAGFLGDRMNRGFLKDLHEHRQAIQLVSVLPSDMAAFSMPVTMEASSLLDQSVLRVTMWRMPPADMWTIVLRHSGSFHVFQDSVELQLVSVMTLFDERGGMVWQGAARSPKYHDQWFSGDQLAALSLTFVGDAVRENVARLVQSTQVEPLD